MKSAVLASGFVLLVAVLAFALFGASKLNSIENRLTAIETGSNGLPKNTLCTEWRSALATHKVLTEIDARSEWRRIHRRDVENAQLEFPPIP